MDTNSNQIICSSCKTEDKRATKGTGYLTDKNGFLYPVPCPDCNGKGTIPFDALTTLSQWFPEAQKLIKAERLRQIQLWGDTDFEDTNPHKILTVLSEEHGEIAKALLERDEENLLEEITQLGALCSKWLELILRKRAGKMNNNVPTSYLGSFS